MSHRTPQDRAIEARIKRELGKRISDLRFGRGMTQEELAEASHKTQEWISRVETGAILPKLPGLMSVIEALGVTLDEVLQEEPVPTQESGDGPRPMAADDGGYLSRTDLQEHQAPAHEAAANTG